jgi:hypothetical protein
MSAFVVAGGDSGIGRQAARYHDPCDMNLTRPPVRSVGL